MTHVRRSLACIAFEKVRDRGRTDGAELSAAHCGDHSMSLEVVADVECGLNESASC